MSNYYAVAAVTTTLQSIIYQKVIQEIQGVNVTTFPLDKARENNETNQINLFLYHLSPNIAWSNHHPIAQRKRGENKKSPLGLNLFYLISVYGEKDNEVKSHQLLGKVISLFHDLSKITSDMIEAATSENLKESNLHQQVEQINITPLNLSLEETFSIWHGFNAAYRPCICYQVSVILIDSQTTINIPLPVLSQHNKQGNIVQLGFLPILTAIELPNRQSSAQLGDLITLRGNNLDKPGIYIRVTHNQLKHSIDITPLATEKPDSIQIRIPNQEQESFNQWHIGLYLVSVIVKETENDIQKSNDLPLILSPKITTLTPKETKAGPLKLRISCTPPLQSKQKAFILWGDQIFPTRKRSHADQPNLTTITCKIPLVSQGEYIVRLRVDGVDSIPINFNTVPWEFEPNQKVVVYDN
ncbi:MAG TPA: hypothetical protein DCF68_17200 [Cyanothece sp. UBA12306]|nr:hypothetical protein [Cyanothece sp. UBA12306]